MRRLLATALTALLALSACTQDEPDVESPAPEATAANPTDAASPDAVEATPRAGVQLFQWNWNSVARECTDVLGPANFSFILLSPAQEHIEGEQWWTSYQPVSYQLESKLGTRDEFRAMVEACHDAGVKVVADAVINHMAGIDGGTGFAGTEFQHKDYPGLYTADDFHDCPTASGNIENYLDQQQIQECQLSGLADLRTGEPEVQEEITAYLDDLVSLGVDGFRIDAAKHMPAEDVEAITSAVEGDPIIISEVIRGSGEPVQPEDYLDAGSVFAFQFARDLAGIIPGGSVHLALDVVDGEVPSEQAYTFVTNHDTERSGQTLSYQDPERYHLANVLLLATPYGTPVLYGGYAFDDRDTGALQSEGRIDDVECAESDAEGTYEPGDWVCSHRDYVGLTEWAAVVGDAEVENFWRSGRAVAFDRGPGFIAVNGDRNEALTAEFSTALPDGTYCDAVSQCEQEFEVVDGAVTLTIEPLDAVALHVPAAS